LRKLLLTGSLIAALSVACDSTTPVGPGTVTVTQTTSSTSTTSTSTTSTVAPVPVLTASFTVSPPTGKIGDQVMVNGSASSAAPGRRIVAYDWDFGDGRKKSGNPSSHDYDAEGTFAIILTVTDDAGQMAMTTRPVTIAGRNLVPRAEARFKAISGAAQNVPADLTLLFQLISGSSLVRMAVFKPLADPVYEIAPGSSYLRGDKTGGIIKGQFVGNVSPLNGKFTGSLTFVGNGCATERVYSGSVGDGLILTGGPLVSPDTACSPSPWPPMDMINMVKQ
jgi:PKD domain